MGSRCASTTCATATHLSRENWSGLWHAAVKGPVEDVDAALRRADGGERAVSITLDHMKRDEGDFVIAYVRDITERKRADEALAHSRDLLDYVVGHASSAIAIHDRDLNYVYVSQCYLDEYGIEGQNVIGRHHYDVFPDLPQKWRDVHQRAQAIEVCRCIYDAYRYTYVNEHLYYPDRVVALNESGDMISAVATTARGEVAGHAALVFPEETREIADLAVVATKAKFRGQSVARRLGEYLSQEALARGLAGLFIEEVTVHTFTQQFCHRLGFRDCAFLLAFSPATMAFKGIAEEVGARRSVIVGFKYLQPPSPTQVYAPARHLDMIARIYAALGAPASFAGGSVDVRDIPDASVLHVAVNTARSVATLRVPVYGRDLERRLHDEMQRLRREDVKVMDVSLNLSLPGTDAVADALEKAGFIFTGLIPGGPSGDWLVLQYFNGVIVDYDAIQVRDDFTRELLTYIRRNDPHAG